MKRPGAKGQAVSALLATAAAVEKLGARGISTKEAEQLQQNRHVVAPNRRRAHRDTQRRLLIGRTDGGRVLTLVIERTLDPTTWLIVTAWPAADIERRILGD
jgi:hypothetical protein